MAKKYLLYIHDSLFEAEPNKSNLVNNLLERHYHDTVGGKTQEQILESIGLSSKGRTAGFGPANLGSSPSEPAKVKPSTALCEHFQPKGFCLTKGCKYA